MMTIYDNTSAFCLMSPEDQVAMKAHHKAGGEIALLCSDGAFGVIPYRPQWDVNAVYRAVRPAPKPMSPPWELLAGWIKCAVMYDSGEVYFAERADQHTMNGWFGSAQHVHCPDWLTFDRGDRHPHVVWRPGCEPEGWQG